MSSTYTSTSRFLSSHLLILVVLATASSVACREDGDGRGNPDGIDFRAFNAASREVTTLQFEEIQRLTLGNTTRGFVNDIQDLVVHRGDYYVLDATDRKVRKFDASGRFIMEFGGRGDGPGEFRDPFALAILDETIFVADPGRGQSLQVFDVNGRFQSALELDLSLGPSAIGAGDGRVFVFTGGVAAPLERNEGLLSVFDASGRRLGRACTPDPIYAEAREADRMIGRFTFGSMSVRGSRVLCVHSASPVVQVFDRNLQRTDVVSIAPPFYEPPPDVALDLSQKAVFEYLSSWTAHRAIFALPDGFLSVYSRYSRDDQQFDILLHRCVNASEDYACSVSTLAREPVFVMESGDIVVKNEVLPNASASISILRAMK